MLLRIKNFFYFWCYFYWARLLFPYQEPNRAEFNKYHFRYWELADDNSGWREKLIDYDEIFVSPCSFNEKNCGGYSCGKYLLSIKVLGFTCEN